MLLEVELKARVAQPEALKLSLARLGVFHEAFHKQDVYFRSVAGQSFRLRLENGQPIVTHKIKLIRDAMEVSQENEFFVSDPQAFQRMMEALGFSAYITKEKLGEAWEAAGIKVDFSLVTGLGHFVELELLLPLDSSEPDIQAAQARLLTLLRALGLSEADLEPTPYTVLLGRLNGAKDIAAPPSKLPEWPQKC